MKKRIECTISGRVQMVMFRDFVSRHAKKLGVVGEVWNEADGTVRVIAEGDELALTDLVSTLHHGPILASVHGVDILRGEPQGAYSQFMIRYK